MSTSSPAGRRTIAGTPKRVRGQLASFDELASGAHARQAFGITILVADLDDIIEAKETLNRETDRVALAELRQLRDQLRRDASGS